METPADAPDEEMAVPVGRLVAFNIGPDEFDEKYAAHYHERVRGIVIKMAPVTEDHYHSTRYLSRLLDAYFSFNPIGILREAPFMLRSAEHDVDREPDIMVILKANPVQPTATMMRGVPDIVIEIVSKESIARDYGEKLIEYERLGVPEYWIVDPLRTLVTVHRLGASTRYEVAYSGERDVYTTALLPRLALTIPAMWQTPPPSLGEIYRSVETMFAEQ